MEGFFSPQGIAIFGVSSNPKNVARAVLQNLSSCRYQGTVVGIGSKRNSFLGFEIYSSIDDVDEPIDLAVIVTPAPSIIPIFQECQRKGITRAVIMTSGFKELKGSGDQLSKDLVKAAQDMNLRFIGPNCQGVINTATGLCLPFGLFPPGKLKRGDISLITQSGSICWMGSLYLSHEIAGVNKVVSIGNKMNVDEVDALTYLLEDDTTRLIVLHLESTENGRVLFEILARSTKPVILFKTQISPEGHPVAFSHTAALADDDTIIEGVSRQAGVMRATTFREMIEMAKALSLPSIRGKSLGIVSASGGVAIMAADTCERQGMKLATLPAECLDKIRDLPKAKVINITNPVDTGNIYDSRANYEAMKMIINLDDVDGGILSQFHPATGDYFEKHSVEEIVKEASALSWEAKKPIALHFLCDPLTREEIKTTVSYPLFDSIEEAVGALKNLWIFKMLRQKTERWDELRGMDAPTLYRFNSRVSLEINGFRLLEHFDIPCEFPGIAREENELVNQAETIGYPVVLKALSPNFTHKHAHGAVALNLRNKQELSDAIRQIERNVNQQGASIDSFLLQKMVSPGPDLFLGGKRDPHYGPVVLLGPGGSDVEAQQSVLCYLAPLSPGMADDMLDTLEAEVTIGCLWRNSLKGILVRFSQLLLDNPHIAEIDLNPLRLLPEAGMAKVLDVRIRREGNPSPQ